MRAPWGVRLAGPRAFSIWISGAFVAGAGACGGGRTSDSEDADGCSEGERRCDGDAVQRCDGGAWNTLDECGGDEICHPSGCSPDLCTGELEPGSSLGCEYLATDLPQWGQDYPGFGVAANQQFSVAVANPWPEPMEVRVERNDAAPGQPAILVEQMSGQVAGDDLVVIPLPQREVSGFMPGGQGRSRHGAEAYKITTSRPSTVYQFSPDNNPDAYSNDASLLIPVTALDASYTVLGWPGAGMSATGFPPVRADYRSYVTIAAARPGTRVRVVSSTHIKAGDAVPHVDPGGELVVELDALETLNLMGDDLLQYGNTDFTGTRIEADGPIAVWSGVECMAIAPEGWMSPEGETDSCCCDHLEEQLYPRSSLGNDYVVVRSLPRSNGGTPEPDVFRIVALTDGTQVSTSSGTGGNFVLNRGESRQFDETDHFTVSSSEPVLVGQFLVSMESTAQLIGDPSFLLVPPVVQHRDSYRFLVPRDYSVNVALVSVPTGVEVRLDGEPTACDRRAVGEVAGVAYDALWCIVPEGSHSLTAEQPFGLTLVGWGPGPVSYGYTGGMDFEPVNEECETTGDCPDEQFCSGGDCVPPIE